MPYNIVPIDSIELYDDWGDYVGIRKYTVDGWTIYVCSKVKELPKYIARQDGFKHLVEASPWKLKASSEEAMDEFLATFPQSSFTWADSCC